MRRIILLTGFMFFLLIVSSQSIFGRTLSFEMYANNTDMIVNVESDTPVSEAILNAGGGFIFSDDDYTIGNLHFALKDEVFLPALTLGLGLKGIWGLVDEDDTDYDLTAIGFFFLGEYDFRKIYYNFPILIQADLTGAPDPMSFGDTDSYIDFHLGVKAYVVKSAAVVAGYKKISVHFDEDSDDTTFSDDLVYFGLELSF